MKLFAKILTYDGDGQDYPATSYPANIIMNDHGATSYDELFIVGSDEDSEPSGYSDQTAIENWHKFANRFGDYIWMQRHIADSLDAKAGATLTDKFNACSNEEKDLVIYYNQMKGLQGGPENTAVATHLISTGQCAPADVGSLMRMFHSESVVRARPAAKARIESSRMIEAIIKYLSTADTQQLIDTMDGYLRGYKDYVLIGSIIPGNEDGLHDYINSFAGSVFFESGLTYEGWTTLVGTLADLRDILNDILFEDNTMTI